MNLDFDIRQQIGDCLIDMEVYKGITKVFVQLIHIFEEKFPKSSMPHYLQNEREGYYDFQSSIGGSNLDEKSVFSIESQYYNGTVANNNNTNEETKPSTASKDKNKYKENTASNTYTNTIQVPLSTEKDNKKDFKSVI